ncbi:hypothetical protein DM01DRAFT_1407137 [Hesseltinella vesiculosa]|uniref:ARM repeat-containing protein n=1 Tax=Hesseltinella vesiculosa TaxID=101127 RepID=A0A1X2GJI2_9FUNG|nr:hypothetical protein DM01DRAFT_1407137 [Hesseltinella vesiculosa]
MPVPTSADIYQTLHSHQSLDDKLAQVQVFTASLSDNMTLEEADEILQVLPPGVLYGSLTLAADTEANVPLVKTLCKLISKVYRPVPYPAIVEDQSFDYLQAGLRHFMPDIRYLAVKLVGKCTEEPEDAVDMINSPLLPLVIATLGFQEAYVAHKAADVLYNVCAVDEECLEEFFASEAINLLKQLVHIHGTMAFRVYDLMVRIGGISEAALKRSEKCGVLYRLKNEMNSPDTMIRLNAIESTNELISTCQSVPALMRMGILQELSLAMDGDDDVTNIDAILIKCAALKLFGRLYSLPTVYKTDVESEFHFLDRLPSFICSDAGNVQEVSLAVVGLVGSHPPGLEALLSHPQIMTNFYLVTDRSIGIIKATTIQTLAKIIGVTSPGLPDEQKVNDMTEKIYRDITTQPDSLKNMLVNVKQPVDHVRLAAYSFLEAVASHPWGVQEFAREFELLGYLLDRTNTHEQQWQEWKFSVVKQLVQLGSEDTLGRHYAMLQQYERQGPYYRPGQVTTAMKSG